MRSSLPGTHGVAQGVVGKGVSPNESEGVRPPFLEIFEEHYSYVYNSLRRLGVPEPDLEDVAHEVFLAVHQRLSTYDPSRPLKAWLFGVAFRAASEFRRLARHHREIITDPIDAADEGAAPDEVVWAKQAQRLVHRALEHLDLDKRAVFVMCEIDGHSMPEVAEALKIPLNTAYSRLRIARERFNAILMELQGGQP